MTTETAIWIEGFGFGDAEVYVNGLLSYRLVDEDRSFDSDGVRFSLVPERGGRKLGTIVRPLDGDTFAVGPVEQIRTIIGAE